MHTTNIISVAVVITRVDCFNITKDIATSVWLDIMASAVMVIRLSTKTIFISTPLASRQHCRQY